MEATARTEVVTIGIKLGLVVLWPENPKPGKVPGFGVRKSSAALH
jgi:hypothetical protein